MLSLSIVSIVLYYFLACANAYFLKRIFFIPLMSIIDGIKKAEEERNANIRFFLSLAARVQKDHYERELLISKTMNVLLNSHFSYENIKEESNKEYVGHAMVDEKNVPPDQTLKEVIGLTLKRIENESP